MRKCPTCNQSVAQGLKFEDYVVINNHIDPVYKEFIGMLGIVVQENDDNSYSVKIENDEICAFEHQVMVFDKKYVPDSEYAKRYTDAAKEELVRLGCSQVEVDLIFKKHYPIVAEVYRFEPNVEEFAEILLRNYKRVLETKRLFHGEMVE